MKKELGTGLNYVLHIMRLHCKYGRKHPKLVKRVMALLAK